MLYLTFGDAPSGVLSSQAIDVVKYMRNLTTGHIRFVAFISPRGFKKNKLKIKSELPDARVLPMFPKIDTWRWNWITLAIYCLLTGERAVIARNVLAVHLALKVKRLGLIKTICLDGRGAIAAEWHEYNVVPSERLKKDITTLEKMAVLKTDFHIAVSNELVNYWKENYGYDLNSHVVIPCTLGLGFNIDSTTTTTTTATATTTTTATTTAATTAATGTYRKKHNLDEHDVVLIYSGSTAGWQSFNLLEDFLRPMLNAQKNLKVIFMTGKDERIDKMIAHFPQQVQRQWVQHADVQQVLNCGDYGIMIRELTVTNKVASPTKFAEYLSAGLQVLISEGLGDYTTFVKMHGCGYVIKQNELLQLEKPTPDIKNENRKLVEMYFTKSSQKENYLKVLNAMH
ncbi:MAG: hypothetical protein ABI723_14665 [Bacteroidia bacterium]